MRSRRQVSRRPGEYPSRRVRTRRPRSPGPDRSGRRTAAARELAGWSRRWRACMDRRRRTRAGPRPRRSGPSTRQRASPC
ncbi:MAG: hypothetical protein DMF83_23995 [Acidobacteria bacterium]|nr:MAG: hypothetical protein DMF83_23995 [Acidobacteriota bacterium]